MAIDKKIQISVEYDTKGNIVNITDENREMTPEIVRQCRVLALGGDHVSLTVIGESGQYRAIYQKIHPDEVCDCGGHLNGISAIKSLEYRLIKKF